MRLLGDVKTAASLIVTTDTAWPALPLATEELDEEVVHHAYAAITNQHYPASREGAKRIGDKRLTQARSHVLLAVMARATVVCPVPS